MRELEIGDASYDNSVTIVDKDRLCYIVRNTYNGTSGLRTISKAILEEFVQYVDEHPDGKYMNARTDLAGKSEIDKFEYGYCSTLWKMAKMVLSGHGGYGSDKEKVSGDKTEVPSALQQIYYGAPGTGKSYEINRLTSGHHVVRTTFHPDSDYSTFVGAYKPTTKQVPLYAPYGERAVEVKDKDGNPIMEDRIVYEFVEQAFLQAYVNAWRLYAKAGSDEGPEEQFLVIEEINRGNCAQIFGDLFQLLDRNEFGFSDYPIKADSDLKKQLAKELSGLKIPMADSINDMYYEDIVSKVLDGSVLLLPSNLYIWATMNTSDQSLFPIDSAFKRRWDWKYIPIADAGMSYTIDVNGDSYDWWSFMQNINAQIGEMTKAEDKKLGYFFCKAHNGVISAERFVSKVVFFLWNDVFKDYEFDKDFLKDADGSELSFDKFYYVDAEGVTRVNEDKIQMFLDNLQVRKVWERNVEDDEDEFDDEVDEDGEDDSLYTRRQLKVVIEGKTIQEKNSIDTFVKAIEYIGVEDVAELDLMCSSYKLLSRKKLSGSTPGGYGIAQRKIGDYWMITKYSNNKKLSCLYEIKEALDLDLEATLE